jgi:hypothetical protein
MNKSAVAWTDKERGTFKEDIFPVTKSGLKGTFPFLLVN